MAVRLSILEPRTLSDRVRYATFRQAFGFYPDVLRALFAHTRMNLSDYGKALREWHRASDVWTKGEVELFASFVSSQNHCSFCMLSHGAVASRFLGEDVVFEAFEDWKQARVRLEVKTVLGMLAKLAREPESFSRDDVQRVIDAGVPRKGVEHALVVGGYLFNYQNRMANSLGATIPRDKIKRAGAMLNLTGRRRLPDKVASTSTASLHGEVPSRIASMIASIRDGDGDADRSVRQAAFNEGMTELGLGSPELSLPADVAAYVSSVVHESWTLQDEDIREIVGNGWSEKQVFEITSASAAGAAYARFIVGLRSVVGCGV